MKTYEINLKHLEGTGLNINEYVFLDLLLKQLSELAYKLTKLSEIEITVLEANGWIKIDNYGTNITKKTIDMFKDSAKDNSKFKVDWIKEWLELFPSGKKSGGYYVKGDIKECDSKMYVFLKENEYTKEHIFKATQQYLKTLAENNYMGLQLAHNFIKKYNTSSLLNYCENLNNNLSDDWATNV